MSLCEQITAELDVLAKEAQNCTRVPTGSFFKEPVKSRNLRSIVVTTLAKDRFAQTGKEKEAVFMVAEELLKTGRQEEAMIAFDWVFRMKRSFAREDGEVFARWMGEYIHNWATCDTFCTRAFGFWLHLFPKETQIMRAWPRASNRWLRRASAVGLIYANRRGSLIDEAFERAKELRMDVDDLVQKGYGWMLKEVSKREPERVLAFCKEYEAVMPRTAYCYALEHFPTSAWKS